MANNLRGYNTEYKLLRNVSNPIMIIGLPLPLALIYAAGMFFPVLLAMLLKVSGVNWVIALAIPAVILLVTVLGVRTFYKKFGVNGFYLKKRDISLFSEIEGDVSVQNALKGIIKNK